MPTQPAPAGPAPPAGLEIRVLGQADADPYFRLRTSALESSPHSFGSHADSLQQVNREQVLAQMADSESGSDNFVLGAAIAETWIGMIGFRREAKLNVAHKATLWGFFVAPEFRGRGIGKALLAAAMAKAEMMDGLHHVRLILTDCDQVARHVFMSQGFEQYGLETKGIRLDGQFYDQAFLLRKL